MQNQSTQAVIQTFFDYPFSLDMYSSSSTLLDGFIGSVVFNSAYAELLKRKDAGECLLERYLLFNPVGCNVAIIMGPLLEMLLAQQEFYTQLNVDEKKELVKAALGKMDVREDFDPLLANRNETTCMLIGRIMENSGFNPFIEEVKNNKKMSKYLEEQFHGYDNYGLILLYANEFIK